MARVLLMAGAVAVLLVAAVALSSDAGSRDDVAGQVIRISITLLIPAAIMLLYWYIVRRQVRATTTDVESNLAEDQSIIDRVSHQIRDQLTVIYGFSETLLDSDLEDRAEVRDVLTVINAEAVDLSRVVDDLVSAAELDSGDVEVSLDHFDPSIEVDRVVIPFRRLGHEMSIDCWSGPAISDAILFRQIVRSLISNAVAHGGSEIAVVGERTTDTLRCTIADDGEGIEPSVERRIFGSSDVPASREDSVGGFGLGLTVSQALARKLGGQLTYERTPDVTMVTLELPAHDWPKAPISAPPPIEQLDDDEEPEEDRAEDLPTAKVRISFEEGDSRDTAIEAPASPS
ncbi:MAG: HAMP domain-containing sensor histidine kinase [Actinomycetota bacterium]